MGKEEFLNFYKNHLNLNEEDFIKFQETTTSGLPSTFRITPTENLNKLKNLFKKYDFIKKVEYLENVYTFDLRDRSDLYKEFIKILVAQTNVGNIQRQEIVSMLPHLFLDVKPNHYVLETCASPGSKTKNLLEIIDDGILISNDKSSSRVNVLVSESSKKAKNNLLITQMDATNFPKLNFKFDRICCDVPCTSDGTFRKMPTILPRWDIKEAISLSSLQLRILKRSLELVKYDGIVVYSTCSLNPIENEYVIDCALKEFDFEIMSNFDFIQYPSDIFDKSKIIVRPGISKFENENFKFNNEKLKNCLRILPQDQNTGGFFIAVLKNKRKECVVENEVTKTLKLNRTFVKADEDTLNKIRKNNDISSTNDYYLSFNNGFKNLFAVSDKIYNILCENQKLKVVYAGIKAFTVSDLRESEYRIKNNYLEQSNIKTDFTMNINDFKLLIKSKDVIISELSFKPSGIYTVQLENTNCKFSGFASHTKTFLYIDENYREAYRQLYDI